MYRCHRFLAAGLVVLVAGCSSSSLEFDRGEEIDDHPTELLFDSSDVFDQSPTPLASACWALHLVPPDVPCAPQLQQDWSLHGTRLFVDGTQSMAARGLTDSDLPDLLAGFCLYEWTGDPSAPLVPPEQGVLDCPAVEPQAGVWSTALHDHLWRVFEAQVGAVGPPTPAGKHPVTVGVVDAGSSEADDMAHVQHAEAMARIIEALACPGPQGCSVATLKALALPLVADGTRLDLGGGDYGTRADVAVGIMEAVTAWRQGIQSGEEPSRLVINLSLGWVNSVQTSCGPGAGCGCTEQDPWCGAPTHVEDFIGLIDLAGSPLNSAYPTQLAAEAVHGALLYASCQGALIVAAAGNAQADSCSGGAVAPAAWADHAAPTPIQCTELGFSPPAGLPPAWRLYDPGAPLVVPVAAVDHGDQPIAITRPGSVTRLVAPGFHASADPAPGEVATDPLTGTSVAAAAVSAGAALLWSHKPTLGPREVVESLYLYGDPLPGSAQLVEHGSSAAMPVRRLSLCKALDGVVFGLDACDDPWTLDHARQDLDNKAQLVAQTNSGPALSLVATSTHDCSACGHTVTVHSTTSADDDGLQGYLFSHCSAPTTDAPQLAGPQPDLPVCPECPVITEVGGVMVHLALNAEYANVTTTGGWLRLEYENQTGIADTVVDLSPVLADLHDGPVQVPLGPLSHSLARVTMGLRLYDSSTGLYLRSNELLLVPSP